MRNIHRVLAKSLGFLLLASFLSMHCQVLQMIPVKPDFKFEKIEFVGFSLEAVKLKLHTKVSNPYPVRLPEARLTLALKVEGVQLAILKSKPQTIPARSVSPVPFDVSIPYSSLAKIYRRVPGKESLLAGLAGQLDIPVPKAARLTPQIPKELTFKFEGSRQIPAVLPSLSIRNFKIIKPSPAEIKKSIVNSVTKDPAATARKAYSFINSLLKKGGRSPGSAAKAGLAAVDIKIKTEFEIVMTNKAAARLHFKSLNYKFYMNGQKFLEGQDTGIANKGRTTVVKVTTTFPLNTVSSALSSAIKKRRVSFKLIGAAGVTIPAIGGNQISYDFDKDGKHSW